MNTHQAANDTQRFLTLLEAHGAKLPAKVRTDLEKGIERARTVRTWRPEGGDFIGAAHEAVSAGRDPFKDEAVRAAVLADRLLEHRGAIVARAGRDVCATVGEHFDALVAALAGVYAEKVTKAIGPAAETLEARGLGPDAEPVIVLGAGSAAATAYATIQAATEAHHTLLNAYVSLRSTAGASVGADPVFLYLDPADRTLIEVRDLGASPTPWEVADAGMGLGLATPAEAADRQRRAVENDAEPTQREAIAAGFRRTHGLGAKAPA